MEEQLRVKVVKLLEGQLGKNDLWDASALSVLEELGPVWDRSKDQSARCANDGCSHPYERHFDSYEDMAPVGCKYCECWRFKDSR